MPTKPNTMSGPCTSARRTADTGADRPSSSKAASSPREQADPAEQEEGEPYRGAIEDANGRALWPRLGTGRPSLGAHHSIVSGGVSARSPDPVRF